MLKPQNLGTRRVCVVVIGEIGMLDEIGRLLWGGHLMQRSGRHNIPRDLRGSRASEYAGVKSHSPFIVKVRHNPQG